MPKRKSLADEIASFMDTRPADMADDDLDDEDERRELLAPEDAPAVMGQRRLRAEGIDLSGTGAKYAGRVTSRAKLDSHKRLRSTSAAGEDGEEEDEDEDEDEDGELYDGEEAGDSQGGEEGEESDEDDDDDDNDEEGTPGDDGNALYAEYEEMQAEESALLSQLKESHADEMERARQVSRQHTAWLQLLQLRIKLQPAMTSTARWPVAAPRPSRGLWGATAALQGAARAAADEASAALHELCSVRHALTSGLEGGGRCRDSSLLSAAALNELGSDADAWWGAIEASDAALRPWIEGAVDELAAEANAAAGGGRPGLAGATFKAVRQGPLVQTEHLLAQLPRGSEARDQGCHQSAERVLGTLRQPGKLAAAAAGGGGADGAAAPITGELYDDGPFYHSLLKELLDTGSTGAVASGAPKLKHTKRPTNNRQSKGRKLSYEVQPKLLNFMFPETPEHPVVLAELFASVFGQRLAAAASGKAAAKAAAPEPEEGIDVAKLFAM